MAGKSHRIGKSIIEIQRSFGTEEKCQAYLEAARWPKGVRCLKCDGDKVSKFVTNETERERVNRKGVKVTVRVPARHLYQCLNAECSHQFSATTGTLFNDSHLPLAKWFQAIALMCNAKKGLSAKQMERDLDVNYRTAWYLNHRIRKAMIEGTSLFTGVVEVDETFIGGAYDRRRKRERHATQPVFGAIQRGTGDEPSKVRVFPIPTNSKAILTGAVKGNVSVKAELLITDQFPAYKSLGKQYQHETVNHIRLEYKRKGDPREIHTNSIEGFWSLFKRGVIGSFHKVSVKHLHRYLNEFEFRFNHRRNEELFTLVILNLVIASAMPYAELIGKASEQAQSEPSEGVPF